MIEKIRLPEDRFEASELKDCKRKNFIYGKNGTGKSSIANSIQEQYCEDYDVRIFQGFNSIVGENKKLDLITLGKENIELQPKIDKQKEEIKKLEKELKDIEQTKNKINSEKEEIEQQLSKFYSESAKKIKNKYLAWGTVNYNRNNFEKDIKLAKKIDSEMIRKYTQVAEEKEIENIRQVSVIFPSIGDFLNDINDIISKNISEMVMLKFTTDEETNWAKQGMKIHSEKKHCVFCGSEITTNRWEDLNSYFNDEVKKLEVDIDTIEKNIKRAKDEIYSIKKIDKINFYSIFHSHIQDLNLAIANSKNNCLIYLEELLKKLEEKKKNIFMPLTPLQIKSPNDLIKLNDQYLELFNENNEYNTKLEEKKKEAQEKLKLNTVAEELEKSEYRENKNTLEVLKKKNDEIEISLKKKKEECNKAKQELKELLSQTIDESLAADNINKLLKKLGNQSFSLVKTGEDEQKGQYKVRGYNGEVRNVETLSTGEKNIVAFLWFIFDLENLKRQTDKEMIIVFDDPMNSNDDTVQYLIIMQLQILLRNIGDRQLFILTHNTHFYLNVRHRWWCGNNDKATYHLIKSGLKSSCNMIDCKEKDIKTSYDSLWAEVYYLYEANKPDYMLNPLRRIFETYQKFNSIKLDDLYTEDIEMQKLLNVNSHSIDDYEMELNGKNREEIIDKVKEIFKNLNAIEHFNHHWNRGKDK